jgi:hypothetical protein
VLWVYRSTGGGILTVDEVEAALLRRTAASTMSSSPCSASPRQLAALPSPAPDEAREENECYVRHHYFASYMNGYPRQHQGLTATLSLSLYRRRSPATTSPRRLRCRSPLLHPLANTEGLTSHPHQPRVDARQQPPPSSSSSFSTLGLGKRRQPCCHV